MNYRHAYHAGNFADVHKHAILALLLAHLRRKETPFHVLDTHAGIGRYDLSGVEAGKTSEFEGGIARLLAGPDHPLLSAYLDLVRAENQPGELRFYPGSPALTRALLRPDDRLTLVELHPEDAATVRDLFKRDRQVIIREEDAYQALRACLPPKERRGLVLIDPPYEVKDEFQRMVKGMAEALRRWPTGIYALWYPIKSPAEVARFKDELVNFGKPCLTAELMLRVPEDETKLNGSGMALINPPWQLDEQLASLLPLLHKSLGCQGGTHLQWLASA
ncbi:MAG TPA: 23S rRNA (adenine(2030)-N(6))-methyltransferase RlmJ [Magnetospirillaceae bacterium]|nr:23S rRNA (adenine(2030)-N(6))-methyltransferase RlmJ [Magnetospirillaceae bacterium]